MKPFKFLILLVFISSSIDLISQDTLQMKEVYTENDLVYRMDGQRFTGLAQDKGKKGNLNYEQRYEDGVILWSNLYFNTKEKKSQIKQSITDSSCG